MFENVKMALGYYKPGKEYWLNIEKIHITDEFASKKVGWKKMQRKKNYFRRTRKFESKVVLNKDFTLVDGYSTYCIIDELKLGKVPVWFED
jgi:hypothetical protein